MQLFPLQSVGCQCIQDSILVGGNGCLPANVAEAVRGAVTAWQPLYFFLMEHTALFLSCPQDFSAPPNLWCVQVSLIFSVILSASSCLYGLYLTKEQHPGVFLAISVLLAGHLLFSKSLAKEQRRPAAPCERERERGRRWAYQGSPCPMVPEWDRHKEGSWASQESGSWGKSAGKSGLRSSHSPTHWSPGLTWNRGPHGQKVWIDVSERLLRDIKTC